MEVKLYFHGKKKKMEVKNIMEENFTSMKVSTYTSIYLHGNKISELFIP